MNACARRAFYAGLVTQNVWLIVVPLTEHTPAALLSRAIGMCVFVVLLEAVVALGWYVARHVEWKQ